MFHLAKSLVQSSDGLLVLHPLRVCLVADDPVLLFEERNGLLDALDGELTTLGLCLLSVVDDLGLGIYRLVLLFDRLFLLIETGDIRLTLTLQLREFLTFLLQFLVTLRLGFVEGFMLGCGISGSSVVLLLRIRRIYLFLL